MQSPVTLESIVALLVGKYIRNYKDPQPSEKA